MTALRRTALLTLLACIALQAGVTARAETVLRLARAALPATQGNPFALATNTAWDIDAALFDTLTHVESNGRVIPWLAERWAEQGDGSWRFVLKPGLHFSDGEPLDAAAVVAVIAYLKGAGAREPGAAPVRGIADAHRIDDVTLDIVPQRPDPLLPNRLGSLWIVPAKAWSAGRENFAAHPIGSGPYTLAAWAPQELHLTRAADSWRKAPSDSLHVIGIGEPTARNAALVSGQVDIAIGSADPQLLPELAAAGVTIYVDALPAVIGVAFNTAVDRRLEDVRVRQAMNYAVDKAAIVSALLAGRAQAAGQVGRSGFFGYNAQLAPYPYDPDKARALLADAGYPNGFAFEMELAKGAAVWDAVFLQAAADLRKIGVQMTVRMVPPTKITASQASGRWDAGAWGAAFYSAAFDALEPAAVHSCLNPAPWFCDGVISAAVEKAAGRRSADDRAAATREVMTLTHDRAQALFLYESVGFIALGPRIAAYQSDFGFVRYDRIVLKGP